MYYTRGWRQSALSSLYNVMYWSLWLVSCGTVSRVYTIWIFCCGKWMGKALGQFLSKTHSLFGARITKTSFTIGFATVMDFGWFFWKMTGKNRGHWLCLTFSLTNNLFHQKIMSEMSSWVDFTSIHVVLEILRVAFNLKFERARIQGVSVHARGTSLIYLL